MWISLGFWLENMVKHIFWSTEENNTYYAFDDIKELMLVLFNDSGFVLMLKKKKET